MKSTDYFVRVRYDGVDRFLDFCSRNGLSPSWMSAGFGGAHADTALYRVYMLAKDATAMKISLQVSIMEIQHD
jgi:hypothetical protein